jgi:hypothetical protein
MLWLRIAGGLVVLLAIAGAVTWCAHTLEKARGYEAAVARADQAEREKVELAKTFAAAQADDVGIAGDLRAFRAEEAARADEWRKKLGAHPITQEVHHDPNPDGTCPPTRERDPTHYRELFNEAVGAAYP